MALAETDWVADAKTVVPAFERRLGARAWLLRQLDETRDEVPQTVEAVLELEIADPVWAAPAHGRWVGSPDLGTARLADEGHRELLGSYLAALERNEVPERRAPWAQPGWLQEVRTWLDCEVDRLGHVVLDVEQVKHWSISCVLRVATDGPELFFKVSLPLALFVDEAVVTRRLAARFPGYAPLPLAIDPERGWMLLSAFEELYGWDSPIEVWQNALRRFAELQVRSAELTDELLADGCLDRRLGVLEQQIEPLLNDSDALHRLDDGEVAELRRLVPELKGLCRRLVECGLPETLVHGDLHLGNVARFDGELLYFDWTDACIAHPFIDLHSLQWQRDESKREALLDAYLEPWREVATPQRLNEAVAVATVVIPLHHAVSYQHIRAGLEPAAKPELDATHAFLREALVRAKALESG